MVYPWESSANNVFRIVILVQWLVSLIIAFFTSSWLAPFILGLPILAVPLILSYTHPSSATSRYAYGIAVQLFAALHIQQAFGMTELHFEIFVMLAFLSYFRDWKVIAISTATVAVHHILFFIVQSSGGSLFIFEEGKLTFYILLIHAGFAVAEGVLLGIMARSNLAEGHDGVIINTTITTIMAHEDQLNLNVDVPVNSQRTSDFGKLINAFKALITEANSLSTKVSSVAQKVNQSSSTLDDSVFKSAEQVKLISSSVEHISHSIDDVADRSKESNDYAEQAKKSTLDTKQSIANSGENVTQLRDTLSLASSAIQTLSVKCNNISEVMQSIKSVAEQTNLLALNAAIESARAGEHGRGFAVVADEVRNLAIKSKDSAEEIEQITLGLITSADASVVQMNDCVKMVDEAATSSNTGMVQMDSVVSIFQLVSDNITKVASAAELQAKNIKSISDSTLLLTELSAEEQDNTKMVTEEAVDLADLCIELEQQLNRFSV